MGKFVLVVRPAAIPPDPHGDREAQAICRRYGLAENQDYEKYLDKVVIALYTRRNPDGTYNKVPWPEGYKPKTRNPNAPKGKRWGNRTEGGKAP